MKTEIDREKVEGALEKIRVGLRAEGGDVELVDIRGDSVYVRLIGSCATCPMSTLTMKTWVETTMKREVPEVRTVQAV
ncbi:MAG: NifU family protein [Nitrospirales bacterium]|nr:NifU family protein [Nitrospirales bacterium]